MNCISINIQGLGNVKKHSWLRSMCNKHNIRVADVQETKMGGIDDHVVCALWGNNHFEFAAVDSIGGSDGILIVWDSKSFIRSHTIRHDNFLIVEGIWSATKSKVMFVSVYFPQALGRKKEVWRRLLQIFYSTSSHRVVMGDFNAVREEKKDWTRISMT